MGSGKGKARRAQNIRAQIVGQAQPAQTTSSFDSKFWQEFVTTSGARAQLLTKYYLGDKNLTSVSGSSKAVSQTRVKEWEKSFQELFSDAIEVGALKLPLGYSATDFEITLKPDIRGRTIGEGLHGRMHILIENKKNEYEKGAFFNFSGAYQLGSTTGILSKMNELVQVLF